MLPLTKFAHVLYRTLALVLFRLAPAPVSVKRLPLPSAWEI